MGCHEFLRADIRSPLDNDYYYSAYHVSSAGYADGLNWDVDDSYGKFYSPFRNDDYIASYVLPNGNVNNDLDVGWGDSVANSYGRSLSGPLLRL